ncbi:MAG: MarR family winged helix-turn-helix transcriptional regulator [Phycisphaerae bacterium]
MQALRRISRAIELHSHSLASRYGLTVPQLAVLKELGADGGRSIGELTRAVHLSQATVTGILDRLQRRGLIERRRGEADKRKVHVWLTEDGRDALGQSPPLLHENFLEAFAGLPDWQQTQILSSLQRIVAMMEADGIEAAPMLTPGPMDRTPEQTRSFFGEPPAGAAPAGNETDETTP